MKKNPEVMRSQSRQANYMFDPYSEAKVLVDRKAQNRKYQDPYSMIEIIRNQKDKTFQ